MDSIELPTGPSPGMKQQISPTGFEQMRRCFLRFAFQQDSDFVKHQMPSAASVLGIASQKLYQELWDGSFLDGEDVRIQLETMWDEQVAAGFTKMQEAAFGEVPNPKTWPYYQVKRISTILDVVKMVNDYEPHTGSSSTETRSEVWLSGHGGLIVGQADVIHIGKDGAEIIDYKTGRIFESDESSDDVSALKPAYERQLLIYSDLYHEMSGEWPIRATISSLNEGSYSMTPDPAKAEEISSDAIKLLERFNDQATTDSFEASPSEDACQYCQFKAICPDYLQISEVTWRSNGTYIRGTVTEVDEAGFWIRLTGVTGNTERAELVVVQIPQTLIGSIKTGFILSLSGLFEREERETLDFRWWSQIWKW